ncbi:DinB family protein [Flammeovirga aprica]|uniref:DinB-like domain-containing protein n=1 Tax=Flammeovirga aprica JL-4 TaxID=694437 RepID=A0A7X9RTQ8_9BACT|nr:DinB family protein [Flammeovirga aprica]NME67684.1 hypothetical protein [Flammeovirga aprica JL-4]
MKSTVFQSAVELSKQLCSLLTQLSEEQYVAQLDLFNGSSIGQHSRHIIEFYQCLQASFEQECSVCYEDRKRSLAIECDLKAAVSTVEETMKWLKSIHEPFYSMNLVVRDYQNDVMNEWSTPTTLAREVHHCNEHAVHHLAIIKIGLQHYFSDVVIAEQVGVAKSTTAYQKEQS